MNDNIPIEEKAYLKLVIDCLNNQQNDLILNRKKLIYKRRYLSDINEIAIFNYRFNYVIKQQERILRQLDSPYFARIIFKDLNSEKEQSIYIGKEDIHDIVNQLVTDWRAPISKLYYQESKSACSYYAPDGYIEVTLLLKRNFSISNGVINSINDLFVSNKSSLTIMNQLSCDDMLNTLLNRNTNSKMHDIIQSIQSEQDNIIRSNNKLLVIQGVAGSGKTIIALHRAAYLLYEYRNRAKKNNEKSNFQSKDILILSPSKLFGNYISSVLPSLAEEKAPCIVFDEYIRNEFERQFRIILRNSNLLIETKDQYYEHLINKSNSDRCSYINHNIMDIIHKVDNYIDSEVNKFNDALSAYIKKLFPDNKNYIDNLIDIFTTYDSLLKSYYEMTKIDKLINELKNNIHNISFIKSLKLFYNSIIDIRDNLKKDYKSYHQSPLFKYITDKQFKKLIFIYDSLTIWVNQYITNINLDMILCYNNFLVSSNYPKYNFKYNEQGSTVNIPYPLIIEILYVYSRYREFPDMSNYKHVIIDECQDYSPLHYEYIKRCLSPDCTMTIVGDLNQSISNNIGLISYDYLNKIFPGKITMLSLKRSYRSTKEITSFASSIFNPKLNIDNINRSGRSPRIMKAIGIEDEIDIITHLIERYHSSNRKSIVIACKTQSYANILYNLLSTSINCSLLSYNQIDMPSDIIISSILSLKGLEFDCVIIPDANSNNYTDYIDRQLLYIACTRALHELAIIYQEEITSFISIQK